MTNYTSNIPYIDKTMSGRNASNQNPDILTISLIILFHIRFIFIIILETRAIALDALFYLIVLGAFCTMKLNKYCLVLVPLVFISLINPAAQNMFLILSSSYIIAVKLSLRQTMKINVICIISVILSVLIMVKLGIIHEKSASSHFYINGAIYNERMRSDLGFGNPNRIAILLYSLIINAYLLIPKYKTNLFLIIVTAISYYIYTLTASRTFLLCIASFVISCIGIRSLIVKKVCLKTRMLLFYLPLLFLILTIYLIKSGYYNISIEIMTSGRLGLFRQLLNQCSLQDYLIGTNLINEQTIDNSYLHLLFSAGIVGFIAAFYLWYKLLSKMDKTTIVTYPLVLSITLYGFSESIWTLLLCYGNMIIWIMMIKNLIIPKEYEREIYQLSS